MLALNRIGTAAKVRDALDHAGIPAIFLKGFVLSHVVWGNARARGAGDIDVMVPESHLEQTARVLASIGGRPTPSQADLRPRRRDRHMHHAVTFRLNDVEVDVHYRLDPIPWVLPVGFDAAWESSREIEVGSEEFRTFDDEFSLMVLAANGGRDGWVKWGQVLEFAQLYQRLGRGPDLVARAESLGLGHRFHTGVVLRDVLAPGTQAHSDRTAVALAKGVLQSHARGVPRTALAVRTEFMRNHAQRVRSIGTVQTYRWGAARLIWSQDGVGRRPDAGIGLDIGTFTRRSAALLARRGRAKQSVVEPAGYLCDLVEAASHDHLDAAAWSHIDAALRRDQLSPSDFAVLPLVAPLVQRDLPDHPFAAIIAGVRRQNRVRAAAAESLVASVVDLLPTSPVLLGDLAAARDYPDPAARRVAASLFIVDAQPAQARALAREVARRTGAEVSGGRWPILERLGTRLTLHRALGAAFDYPGARALLAQPSRELQLYDCLIRTSSRGTPAVLWYADAINGDPVDWQRTLDIARASGWVTPVRLAMQVMYERGHDVLPIDAADSLLDEFYWNSTDRYSRAALGRLRMVRRNIRRFP